MDRRQRLLPGALLLALPLRLLLGPLGLRALRLGALPGEARHNGDHDHGRHDGGDDDRGAPAGRGPCGGGRGDGDGGVRRRGCVGGHGPGGGLCRAGSRHVRCRGGALGIGGSISGGCCRGTGGLLGRDLPGECVVRGGRAVVMRRSGLRRGALPGRRIGPHLVMVGLGRHGRCPIGRGGVIGRLRCIGRGSAVVHRCIRRGHVSRGFGCRCGRSPNRSRRGRGLGRSRRGRGLDRSRLGLLPRRGPLVLDDHGLPAVGAELGVVGQSLAAMSAEHGDLASGDALRLIACRVTGLSYGGQSGRAPGRQRGSIIRRTAARTGSARSS